MKEIFITILVIAAVVLIAITLYQMVSIPLDILLTALAV